MSIARYDIVVFLDADWETAAQKNRQHFLIPELARQLAGRSRVLGVERPICPWTGPFRRRAKFMRWLLGQRGLRRVARNIHIYTPFVFVHNVIAAHIPKMAEANRCLLRVLLGSVLKRLGFRTDSLIAWIHHPYQLEDVGLVAERHLFYDCYDDYIAAERIPSRRCDLASREKAILDRAHGVFVVSEELLRAKNTMSARVHLVPNGVEFEHFARAASGESETATQDRSAVLGFTGKITPRIDFRLLVHLATAHPEWTLAMIGPHEDTEALKRNADYRAFVDAPNVHLLGPRPYRDLPRHMRAFDICLLPYTTDDPFNIHCSPLKLYEYLATGKPIVSTDLPAVRPFDGLVRIARDAEEFERQVAAALEEQDEDLRQRRLAVARENSWESRAKTVLQIMECGRQGRL